MEDWQQRVLQEKAQLDAKLRKLTEFLNARLGKKILSERQESLLRRQRDAMREYSDILDERIKEFALAEEV